MYVITYLGLTRGLPVDIYILWGIYYVRRTPRNQRRPRVIFRCEALHIYVSICMSIYIYCEAFTMSVGHRVISAAQRYLGCEALHLYVSICMSIYVYILWGIYYVRRPLRYQRRPRASSMPTQQICKLVHLAYSLRPACRWLTDGLQLAYSWLRRSASHLFELAVATVSKL